MDSRLIGFPVVASTVVLCTYVLATMWAGSLWNLIWKIPIALLIFLVAILSIDSSLGMMTQRGDTSPTVVSTRDHNSSSKELFLLLHGYNGRGESLVEILGEQLGHHGVVFALQPSLKRSSIYQTAEKARTIIETHPGYRVHLYGESLGGMTAATLLRMVPGLRLASLTLNAMPSRGARVKMGGEALRVFSQPWLYGGPISTWALRLLQKAQVGPLPEAGAAEETIANRADRASLSITAQMAFSQLDDMGNFAPLRPGEFPERVGHVRSIHAPGDEDAMVKNAESFADIASAFPGAVDISMPWPKGEHTPTPRRGADVAEQILIAAGLS